MKMKMQMEIVGAIATTTLLAEMVIVHGEKEKMKVNKPFETIRTDKETQKKIAMARRGFELLWEMIDFLLPEQYHGMRRDKEIILEKLKEAQMWTSVALAERNVKDEPFN